MRGCEEVRELIPWYVEGNLAPEEGANVATVSTMWRRRSASALRCATPYLPCPRSPRKCGSGFRDRRWAAGLPNSMSVRSSWGSVLGLG
jgi:hypothetical protein